MKYAPVLYTSSQEEFSKWIAAHNRKVTHRPPLDCPGTDDYFAAVMGEMDRAADARCRSKAAVKPPRARKVNLIVTRHSKPTPQRCEGCNRFIEKGEQVWAHDSFPAVACKPCYRASTSKDAYHFRLVTL